MMWLGHNKRTGTHNRYLMTVSRYIELNPVKAGLVECPEDYNWSSARAHCCGEGNSILSDHQWFVDEVKVVYRENIKKIDPQQEDAIRKATLTGRIFGCVNLSRKLEGELQVKLTSRPRGRPVFK